VDQGATTAKTAAVSHDENGSSTLGTQGSIIAFQLTGRK